MRKTSTDSECVLTKYLRLWPFIEAIKVVVKISYFLQDSSDVGSAKRTHRVCVLAAESRSQCRESGSLGEDSTTQRGKTHSLATTTHIISASIRNIFPLSNLHTGSDRPGGVCRGSPPARGECVCQRHVGPFPSALGSRLWTCGCHGCSASGQHHHLTH